MITKIYTMVSNGGDGSVSVRLYSSEELATWVEEHNHYDDGWAESSVSSISIEHEGPISVRGVVTPFIYLVNLASDDDSYFNEFRNHFFPNGIPEYVDVLLDGKVVTSSFEKLEISLEDFRKKIEG